MTKTMVKVRKNGRYITSGRRSIRRLPDGRTGVSWAGTVYPLHEPGPYIELSDSGFRWHATTPWAPGHLADQLGEQSGATEDTGESNESVTLFFDYSGRHAYIMLSCTTAERNGTISLLSNLGLTLLGYGPASRAASNGDFYDWYLRLSHKDAATFHALLEKRKDTGGRVTAEITRADTTATSEYVDNQPTVDLGGADAAAQNGGRSTVTDIWDIPVEGTAWWEEIYEEHQESGEQPQIGLNSNAERSEVSELASELETLKNQVRELVAKVDKQLGSYTDNDFGQDEINRVLELLKERESDLEALQRSAAKHASDYEELFKAYDEKCEQSKSQSEIIRELEAKAERLSNSLRRRTRFTDDLILGMFSECEFLRDSLQAIAELETAGGFARRLLSALHGGSGPQAKPIQSAPGWLELHFSTGRDDSGRVYFRRNSGKHQVLVSFKGEQETDLAWLGTLK